MNRNLAAATSAAIALGTISIGTASAATKRTVPPRVASTTTTSVAPTTVTSTTAVTTTAAPSSNTAASIPTAAPTRQGFALRALVEGIAPARPLAAPVCASSAAVCVTTLLGRSNAIGDLTGSVTALSAAWTDVSTPPYRLAEASTVLLFEGTIRGCGSGTFAARTTAQTFPGQTEVVTRPGAGQALSFGGEPFRCPRSGAAVLENYIRSHGRLVC